MKVVTHKSKRICDGRYEYRGFFIERSYSVSNGYYGRWSAKIRGKYYRTSSMAAAKAEIDKFITTLEG